MIVYISVNPIIKLSFFSSAKSQKSKVESMTAINFQLLTFYNILFFLIMVM